MISILKDLPNVYRYTGIEQTWCPFFPLLLLITLLLAIERGVYFIRTSRKIYKTKIGENTVVDLKVRQIEYRLSQHLVWFLVIAVFSLFRIGITLFYGLYDFVRCYEITGEISFTTYYIGLKMMAADMIFIVITVFVSTLCFIAFHYWKKRMVYLYYTKLVTDGR